jgi:hypothetical protein
MMEISHFFKHDPDFCDHRDRILSEEFWRQQLFLWQLRISHRMRYQNEWVRISIWSQSERTREANPTRIMTKTFQIVERRADVTSQVNKPSILVMIVRFIHRLPFTLRHRSQHLRCWASNSSKNLNVDSIAYLFRELIGARFIHVCHRMASTT